MKIKNMKLMLLGLLATMSMNAFAADADEADRSVNGIKYKLTTTYKSDGKTVESRTATVIAVNTEATADQKKTIVVPATVNGDNNVEYKVVGFGENWGANAATTCTSLTINVDNMTSALAADAFSGFTKLETLVINDGGSLGKTTEFPAGVSKTIKSVDFTNSKIKKIADNAFKECTALASCPLTGIEEVGASAFEGCYGITELTIPNTVKKIGDGAFAKMYNAEVKDGKTIEKGLQTLTFNANDAITEIPAAFAGDNLLKSVTITSAKATSIKAGAFTGAENLETLDLSGCTALKDPIDAVFTASKFVDVKLAGTKLTTVGLDLSEAKRTLKSITFPAAITAIPSFQNFVALESVDLSNTQVTVIDPYAFQITGAEKDDKGKEIAPKLASVTLNAKTTKIGAYAFDGQTALATIANLNQGDLTEIGAYAFNEVKLSAVDLSSAAKLKKIPAYAFANMATLTSINLNKAVEEIETGAFAFDTNVASINLSALENLKELNPIFHPGVYSPYEGWYYVVNDDGSRSYTEGKEAPVALKSLTLPAKLEKINAGALQLLDIEEIEIPATVTSMGERALQGCIYLKTFTWTDCQASGLDNTTFLGTDKMENVYFMGNINPTRINLSDKLFFGNQKEVLTVHVTGEAYEYLEGTQNWNMNSTYSTLVGESESDLSFPAAGHNAEGYWRTYLTTPEITSYYDDGTEKEYSWSKTPATWIKAGGAVKVYGAVIEGANVVLKDWGIEEGYYKIEEGEPAILLSQEPTVKIELKYLSGNKKTSTKDWDNDLTYSWNKNGVTASRLKYQYKLGAKDGQVKFWRVTSGTIKQFVPYLWTQSSSFYADREFLDIVFDSEATAIQGVQTKVEKNSAIYNLQGVRVNKAQKGLYIQNGKKFIVK